MFRNHLLEVLEHSYLKVAEKHTPVGLIPFAFISAVQCCTAEIWAYLALATYSLLFKNSMATTLKQYRFSTSFFINRVIPLEGMHEGGRGRKENVRLCAKGGIAHQSTYAK